MAPASRGAGSSESTTLLDHDKEKGEGAGEGLLDDGALEPGGTIDVLAPENLGYLLQNLAAGMVMSALAGTQYALFICYLNVPAYSAAAAATLINLPWSFKIAFALISDQCPIRGSRRKPYMALGWTITTGALLALALKPLPAPYYCRDPHTGQYDTKRVCNKSAADEGAAYALTMFVASLGYVMAVVATDALTVTYARREPRATRGKTQTLAYLLREFGSLGTLAVIGLGLNGPLYCGKREIAPGGSRRRPRP